MKDKSKYRSYKEMLERIKKENPDKDIIIGKKSELESPKRVMLKNRYGVVHHTAKSEDSIRLEAADHFKKMMETRGKVKTRRVDTSFKLPHIWKGFVSPWEDTVDINNIEDEIDKIVDEHQKENGWYVPKRFTEEQLDGLAGKLIGMITGMPAGEFRDLMSRYLRWESDYQEERYAKRMSLDGCQSNIFQILLRAIERIGITHESDDPTVDKSWIYKEYVFTHHTSVVTETDSGKSEQVELSWWRVESKEGIIFESI